jgi:hypothetical protein
MFKKMQFKKTYRLLDRFEFEPGDSVKVEANHAAQLSRLGIAETAQVAPVKTSTRQKIERKTKSKTLNEE